MQTPNASVPMAPPVLAQPAGNEPAPSADESAMAAALAAGPMHGANHLPKMTKPSHNMKGGGPDTPSYGPASN